MALFDFMSSTERYADKRRAIRRLEARRRFIIDPFKPDLAGARVLDLASHDGRWSYALAASGAREVLGIEARPELIAQFKEFPQDSVSAKCSFIEGDVFAEVANLASSGERFDVVAIFGLYYHVMDHYQLLKLVRNLEPRLIIIDSEFANYVQPIIRIFLEPTATVFNTIAHTQEQERAPVGAPSWKAMELMAQSLGYDVEWADWESLPLDERQFVPEYFRHPATAKGHADMRRGSCSLRPHVSA
jgi:hypothetical protein